MYKDVGKRILAFVLMLCMVVTLVQWPMEIEAAAGPVYHIYQYGGIETADFVSEQTAAAVFMTSQNASEGAEIFEGVTFDVHAGEGANLATAGAKVSLYVNPAPGEVDSGIFVASEQMYGLEEGTNKLRFTAATPRLERGQCFVVRITLTGEGISFYTDEYDGALCTFVQEEDGSWRDMGESGQAVVLRAVTYDERVLQAQRASLMDRALTALSSLTGQDDAALAMGTPTDGNGNLTASGEAENQNDGSNETNVSGQGDTADGSGDAVIPADTENQSDQTNGADGSGDAVVPADTENQNTPTDGLPGSGTNNGLVNDGIVDGTEETEQTISDEKEKVARTATASLDPANVRLGVGQDKAVSVKLDGTPDGTVTYAWTSGDTAVAAATPNGDGATANIYGVAEGSTIVSVTVADASGEIATLQCPVEVATNVGSLTVELASSDPIIYNGQPQMPAVIVKDGDRVLKENDDYSVGYENNTNVTTPGNPAVIIVTGHGNYAATVRLEFEILPAELAIANVTVEEMHVWVDGVTDSDMVQTADDVKARFKVTGVDGNLLDAASYTIELDGNPAAAGTHRATVTGVGTYTGTFEVSYTVKQNVVNLDVQLLSDPSLPQGTWIYTGNEIHPEVEVYENGVKLMADSYTATYANCTSAGTGTVTVEGQGNYYGTVVKDFTIVPKDVENRDDTRTIVKFPEPLPVAARVDATLPLPDFTVTYNGKDLIQGTDYNVTATPVDGTDATATRATLTVNGLGNFKGTRVLNYQIGTDINTAIDSVALAQTNATYTGSAITPKVTVTAKAGFSLTEGVDYEVEYRNNVNVGNAEVCVRGKGKYGGTFATVPTFTITAADLATFDSTNFTYRTEVPYSPNPEAMKPEVKISYNGMDLKAGTDYTLQYALNDNLKVGTGFPITVTGTGNFASTKTLNYAIVPCSLSDQSAILVEMVTDYKYTGLPIEPELTIKHVYADENGNQAEKVLVKDTDYTVTYPNGNTDYGTREVMIKGQGNYGGTIVRTFNISKIAVDTLKLEIADAVDGPASGGYDTTQGYAAFRQYTGNEITLNVKLTYLENASSTPVDLIEGMDYTITYDNNKDMSKKGKTAGFTIEGKGNYGGTMRIPFLIYKDIADCDVSGVSDQVYTGEPITFNRLTLKDGIFNTLKESIDYQVTYEKNTDVVTDAGVTISAMPSLPTENGCYWGSQSRTFAITQRNLKDLNDAELEEIVKPFEGKDVTLELEEIKLSYAMPSGARKTLAGTTDFTIDDDTYSDNDKVSTEKNPAYVYISGEGNYTGVRRIDFMIAGKGLSKVDYTLDKTEYLYTGNPVKPIITLVDNEAATPYTLKEGTDYSVEYADNVNAGKEAKIILTGLGNYAGGEERTIHFEIKPLDFNNNSHGTYDSSGIKSSYTFEAKPITPEPAVKYTQTGAASQDTLKSGRDYELIYNNNTDAGTATLTVKGTGNYTGTIEHTFAITAKDLSEQEVSIAEIPPQPWTGKAVCPDIEAVYNGYTLVRDKDYTLTYTDNINRNDNLSVVTITGKGNFAGTVTKNFSIVQSIENDDIDVTCAGAGERFTYTGHPIKPEVVVTSSITGGKLTEDTDYEVVYEDNEDVGRASILVRGIGKYSGEFGPMYFYITEKNIADVDVVAKINQSSYEYTGAAIEPNVTITYGDVVLKDSDVTVIYENQVNAGTGTITIQGYGNYIGTKRLNYTIAAKSIGSGTAFTPDITMEKIGDQGYTGEEIRPVPVLHRRNADKTITTLIHGTDFTCAYRNNTNVGTATITITGIGNYTGTVNQNFNIKSGLVGAEISLNGMPDGTMMYEDGTLQSDGTYRAEPQPTVRRNGTILSEGRDYTVSYQKNDFPGEAKVIITGAGLYGGTIEKSFYIYGDLSKAKVGDIGDVTYTGAEQKPNPEVTYYGRTLRDGVDYIRNYTNNVNVGTAKLTIDVDDEIGSYFTGSITKEFEITPAEGKFVITGIKAQTYRGSAIEPEFTVTYNGAKLIRDTDYRVDYENNVNAGRAKVTVTGMGGYDTVKQAITYFAIDQLDINDVVIDNGSVFSGIPDQEYTGSAIIPDTKLCLKENGKVIYELKPTDYEIVCPDGNNIEVGPVNVTITGMGQNVRGTRTESFNIVPKNVENVELIVSGNGHYAYTGLQITPKVTMKNGQKVLVEGQDYTVAYGANVNVGDNTGEIIVTGAGNYTGTREALFAIDPLNVVSNSVGIAAIAPQEYTGEAVCPKAEVTYVDPQGTVHDLVEGVDYTLDYKNNIETGNTARLIIKGMGNFTGDKTQTFAILPHDIASEDVVVGKIGNQIYTGEECTPSVTITYGTRSLVRGTDYTVTYENNVELGTGEVIIDGTGNFTGTRTETFEIVEESLEAAEVTGLKDAYVYTGKEIVPDEVVVSLNGVVLIPETDYFIECRDNINAGSNAILAVMGAGKYGGTKEVPFIIEQKDIEETDVVLSGFEESKQFTGDEVTQDISLIYGDITLVEDTDYIVQYVGNTAIGTATMTITGTGNYTGKITKEFEISQNTILDNNLLIENMSSTYTYNGSPIMPEPMLSIDGNELVKGEDYEIEYINNVNAGTASMMIRGIGNFSGEREEKFEIIRKSIQLATFGNIPTQVYTGAEIRPGVSVQDNGNALAEGRDYSLLYANNRKAGVAKAIVAGNGNYTATKTINFNIMPGGITGIAVTGTSDSTISLSWSGSSAVTGYEIFRAPAGGKYQRIARKAGTSYTDSQLNSGTSYSYKVRAYLVTENDTYYSEFSTIVQGSTY